MAVDGRFFRPFAVVDRRSGTPVPAILLLGAMSIALLLAAGIVSLSRGDDSGQNALGLLLTGVVFIDGIFFALTGLALLVLRRKRPDAIRSVRVPLYPLVPILFVLGEVGIVVGAYLNPSARQAALIGAGWIAAAGLVYLIFFRRRNDS
jgi:APA family basic amino acid/polyamine antiporter